MTLGADRRTFARYSLGSALPQMFSPDPDKGASGNKDDKGDPPDADDADDDDDENDDKGKPPRKPEGWNDSIDDYVSRLVARETRKARQKAEQDAADKLAKEKADADAEAERKRLEEAGEFETVKTTLIKERDDARTEAADIKTERDALMSFFDGQYTAAVNDLPDVVKAFKPADDASFEDKKRWLETAQEQAKALGEKRPARGSGENPPPRNKQQGEGKDEEVARSRRRPGYSSF